MRFQPGFYAWVCILAACITLPSVSFVAGMKQTERAVRASELAAAKALSESQQAWCPMVITFDNAWRDNPPAHRSRQTDRGRHAYAARAVSL